MRLSTGLRQVRLTGTSPCSCLLGAAAQWAWAVWRTHGFMTGCRAAGECSVVGHVLRPHCCRTRPAWAAAPVGRRRTIVCCASPAAFAFLGTLHSVIAQVDRGISQLLLQKRELLACWSHHDLMQGSQSHRHGKKRIRSRMSVRCTNRGNKHTPHIRQVQICWILPVHTCRRLAAQS